MGRSARALRSSRNGQWPDDHFRRDRQPMMLSVRRRQTADNRDYRWSSTPDADRCAVFGIRLGQRPSEPLDLAARLRPAAILQLPDTRRACLVSRTGPPCLQNPLCSKVAELRFSRTSEGRRPITRRPSRSGLSPDLAHMLAVSAELEPLAGAFKVARPTVGDTALPRGSKVVANQH